MTGISSPLDIRPGTGGADFKLLELPYKWELGQGTLEYAGAHSVIFWTRTSLAELLRSMLRIAGEERYGYVLQAQGRLSEEEDWNFISSHPTFLDGLRGINQVAVTAGWGRLELVSYEPERKRAVMRIYNSWESICHQAMGMSLGTHYFAGKIAGWFSHQFKTNCWCVQRSFIVKGDPFDEFLIEPTEATVAQELERIEREEAARKSCEEDQAREHTLKELVEQRTQELRAAVERLERAQSDLLCQAATIAQLSTPVVQIWDGILMVPVVGQFDSDRAERLLDAVLKSINQRRCRVVLLDITGVPIVDKAVANALIRTVNATKLLGAQTMLVGISAQVAQSIVVSGVDLSQVFTCGDLRQGLDRAFQIIGVQVKQATV